MSDTGSGAAARGLVRRAERAWGILVQVDGARAQAQTIDEVLARLDAIVARARADASRLGYFAALYRRVTARVQRGLAQGEFREPELMAQLDVIFANRYLDAYSAYRAGLPITRAWRVAFEAAASARPIVLQHLLLGMNAHINLDLAIATAQTMDGHPLELLHADFDHMNVILGELTGTVRAEMERIWPVLRWLDAIFLPAEDSLIHFSMSAARVAAWRLAERLAPLDAEARARQCRSVDAEVAALGTLIRHPGVLSSLKLLAIRLGELADVRQIIDILYRP